MSTPTVVYALCTITGGVMGAQVASQINSNNDQFGMNAFFTGAGVVFGGISGMATAGVILRIMKK